MVEVIEIFQKEAHKGNFLKNGQQISDIKTTIVQ